MSSLKWADMLDEPEEEEKNAEANAEVSLARDFEDFDNESSDEEEEKEEKQDEEPLEPSDFSQFPGSASFHSKDVIGNQVVKRTEEEEEIMKDLAELFNKSLEEGKVEIDKDQFYSNFENVLVNMVSRASLRAKLNQTIRSQKNIEDLMYICQKLNLNLPLKIVGEGRRFFISGCPGVFGYYSQSNTECTSTCFLVELPSGMCLVGDFQKTTVDTDLIDSDILWLYGAYLKSIFSASRKLDSKLPETNYVFVNNRDLTQMLVHCVSKTLSFICIQSSGLTTKDEMKNVPSSLNFSSQTNINLCTGTQTFQSSEKIFSEVSFPRLGERAMRGRIFRFDPAECKPINPLVIEKRLSDNIVIRGQGVNLILPCSEFHKLPHELVCHNLGLTSDVKIGSLEINCAEPFKSLSPDSVLVDGNSITIHEITTTISERTLESSYERKIITYADLVSDLTSKGYTVRYYVTVISQNTAFSNYSHTNDSLKACCVIYNAGRQALNRATEIGLIPITQELESLKEKERKIAYELMNCEHYSPNEKRLEITLEDMRIWKDEEHTDVIIDPIKDKLPKIETQLEIDHESLVSDYWRSVDEIATRRDNKSCSIFPLFNLIKDTSMLREESLLELTNDIGALQEVVMKISNNSDPKFLEEIDFEVTPSNNEKDFLSVSEAHAEKFKNDTKKNWHRVTIDIDEEFKEKLFKEQHLFGSGFKEFQNVNTTSGGFKSDTDTDDIDDFVKFWSRGLFEESQLAYMHAEALNMRRQVQKLLRYSELNSPLFETLSRTRVFESLSIIQDISRELTYSLRQRTSTRTFILKKVGKWPIWLIIKPTRTLNMVWFSILIKRESLLNKTQNCFQKFKDIPGTKYLATNFVSVDTGKLEQFVRVRDIFCLSILGWMRRLFIDSRNEQNYFKEEVFKTAAVIVLLLLENKSKTSATMQNTRFMYMEMTTSDNPNPFKMIKKFPTIIRSRVLLYLTKSIFQNFLEMIEVPLKFPHGGCQNLENLLVGTTTETNEDDGISVDQKDLDKVHNLLNCYTGCSLTTFSQALFLSYFYYFHAKEDINGFHGEFQILEKLIVEELKLHSETFERYSDPKHSEVLMTSEKTAHIFDSKVVSMLGRMLSERLTDFCKNEGTSVKTLFLKNLAKTTVEEVSTFKSSNVMQEVEINYNYDSKKNSRTRSKMIEQMISKDHLWLTNPFDKLSDIIKSAKEFSNKNLLSDGTKAGLLTSTFVKPQLGQTREIFIMPSELRISVKVIETFSRSILSKVLPNETLSLGDQKDRAIENAYSSLKSLAISLKKISPNSKQYKYKIHSDSIDCKTWCQQFIMPVFACFLSHSIPEDFWQFFISTLNMITNKMIVINPKILKSFSDRPELESFIGGIDELKEQFLGIVDENTLINPNETLLKNSSNMMQGVLHFTSSILHATILKFLEEFLVSQYLNDEKIGLELEQLIQGKLTTKEGITKKVFPEIILKLLTRAGSDDAEIVLISVWNGNLKDGEELADSAYYCISLIRDVLYKKCGILMSEKSTLRSTSGVHEFNSNWYASGSTLSPLLPHCVASVTAKSTINFENRFNVNNNCVSDILSKGGTLDMSFLAEALNELHHYENIGLYRTGQWNTQMCILALKKPHTLFGVHLPSPDYACGILPYRARQYLACQKWKEYSCTDRTLRSSVHQSVNEDGHTVFRVEFDQGKSRKFQTIKEKLNITSEYQDYLKEKPEVLFVGPNTHEDQMNLLHAKFDSPGAREAYSELSKVKEIAMSVYIMRFPTLKLRIDKERLNCFEGAKDNSKPDSTFCEFRVSLSHLITSFNPENVRHTEEELQLLFPDQGSFKPSLEVIPHLTKERMIVTPYLEKRRERRLVILAQKSFSMSPIRLIDLVKWKYFKQSIFTNRIAAEKTWLSYKKHFPWLKDTITDTMANLPFESVIAFYRFITRLSSIQGRSMKLQGDVRKMRTIKGTLLHFISRNTINGKRIRFGARQATSVDPIITIMRDFNLLKAINSLENRKLAKECKCFPTLQKFLNTSDYIVYEPTLDKLSHLSSTEPIKAKILALQMIAKGRFNTAQVLERVKMLGVHYFEKRQTRNDEGKYVGPGEIFGCVNSLTYSLTLEDSFVIGISVNSRSLLMQFKEAILRNLKDSKLTIKDSYHSYTRYKGVSAMNSQGQLGREGCPVYETPELVMPSFDTMSLRFTFGYSNIRLEKQNIESGDWSTVLSQRIEVPEDLNAISRIFGDYNKCKTKRVHSLLNDLQKAPDSVVSPDLDPKKICSILLKPEYTNTHDVEILRNLFDKIFSSHLSSVEIPVMLTEDSKEKKKILSPDELLKKEKEERDEYRKICKEMANGLSEFLTKAKASDDIVSDLLNTDISFSNIHDSEIIDFQLDNFDFLKNSEDYKKNTLVLKHHGKDEGVSLRELFPGVMKILSPLLKNYKLTELASAYQGGKSPLSEIEAEQFKVFCSSGVWSIRIERTSIFE